MLPQKTKLLIVSLELLSWRARVASLVHKGIIFTMTTTTAIVTGGSSGIGEALVQHLVSIKWRVVIADINAPKVSIPETIFIQTNIASWQEQADMFKQAYAWTKRLDFVALNAGVDDRDDIFNTLSNDVNKPPSQPNTRPFDVNVTGT